MNFKKMIDTYREQEKHRQSLINNQNILEGLNDIKVKDINRLDFNQSKCMKNVNDIGDEEEIMEKKEIKPKSKIISCEKGLENIDDKLFFCPIGLSNREEIESSPKILNNCLINDLYKKSDP